jgi:hypothetical protein
MATVGEFVVTVVGSFDGERSHGTWTVVPGSGTGDLVGIVGTGSFKAGPSPQASYQLSHMSFRDTHLGSVGRPGLEPGTLGLRVPCSSQLS